MQNPPPTILQEVDYETDASVRGRRSSARAVSRLPGYCSVRTDSEWDVCRFRNISAEKEKSYGPSSSSQSSCRLSLCGRSDALTLLLASRCSPVVRIYRPTRIRGRICVATVYWPVCGRSRLRTLGCLRKPVKEMMQSTLFKTAVAVGAWMLLAAPATAASAQAQTSIDRDDIRSLVGSDLSAARKKQKRTAPAPKPQAQMQGWGGWRPADPSFDQNGRPYQPPPGLACPVDLGYGRWGSCNNDY